MNWVLLSVIVILAVFGFIGWKKGIIQIVVSLATLIVTILLSVFIAPVVCQGLKTSTELDEGLQKIVYNVMMEQKFGGDNALTDADNKTEGEAVADIDAELPEELKNIEANKADIDKYAQQIADNALEASLYAGQIVDKLDVPENVKNQMKQIVSEQNIKKMVANNDIVKIINQTDGSMKSIMISVAATKLTDIIFRAIVYVIVFIVVFAILKVVVAVTNLVSRLPIIKQANKIGGLALGLVEGLIAVWIMFVVITACGSMEWAAAALTDISNNKLLSMLYESDIILKLIFK